MNLSLIDPFILAQDYPEALTGKIRTNHFQTLNADLPNQGSGHATCIRFNRKGDFLASGRVNPNVYVFSNRRADRLPKVDGTIVIFDVETNGIARKLRGHTRQIQALRYNLNT